MDEDRGWCRTQRGPSSSGTSRCPQSYDGSVSTQSCENLPVKSATPNCVGDSVRPRSHRQAPVSARHRRTSLIPGLRDYALDPNLPEICLLPAPHVWPPGAKPGLCACRAPSLTAFSLDRRKSSRKLMMGCCGVLSSGFTSALIFGLEDLPSAVGARL